VFYLLLWPILIGVAPLALPITCELVALSFRILISAHAAIVERRIEGERSARRARYSGPPLGDGPERGRRFPGRMRIDVGEEKRHRLARLRLPSQ
jgi:hypothetical protein